MTGNPPDPRPPRPSLAEEALRPRALSAPPASWWRPLAWTSWLTSIAFTLLWVPLVGLQKANRDRSEDAAARELMFGPLRGPAIGAAVTLLVILATPARRWKRRVIAALTGIGSVLGWLSAMVYLLARAAR